MFSIVPALAYMLLFCQANRLLARGCSQCLNRAYSVNCSILYTKTPHLFQRHISRFFHAGKKAHWHAPADHGLAPEAGCATVQGGQGAIGCIVHAALCFALLAVPAGSLPALWAWPYAGGVLLGILLWAAVLQPYPKSGTARAGGMPGLAGRPLLLAFAGLVLVWGGLGLCSWHRGLPGYFWHLDAFVAHPLWCEVSPPGKVSLAVVLVGLCSLLPRWPRQEEQTAVQPLPVAYVAWVVLWQAVVVSLLVPFTLGQWLGGSWWIVADFFLFWGKVGVLVFVVSPCCVRWLGPWGGACLLVAGLGGMLLWGLR